MQNPESTTPNPDPPPRRRRKFRRWLAAAVILSGLLVALNGPGLRWLQKSGIQVKFTLEGSLTGGLVVRDFHLEGYQSLASLSIDRVTPIYPLKGLLGGRIKGVAIDGLHADLRLTASKGQSLGHEQCP